MNKLGLVDSSQHVVNFFVYYFLLYTSYSYDSHIYVLSSYTSVVSLTYALIYIRPHICSFAVQFDCLEIFSLPDDDILFGDSCRHLRLILGDG